MYKTTRKEGLSSRAKRIALLAAMALAAALVCGLIVGCSPSGSDDAADEGTTEAVEETADEAAGEAAEEATGAAAEGDMDVLGGIEDADAAEAGDSDATMDAGDVNEYSDALAQDEESRDAGSNANMQTIGSRAVGYMAIPSTWVDRIEDVDPNLVDAYEMVYYADPDSEYTSAAYSHFAFSKAVQMKVMPTSYREVAEGIAESYKNSEITGDFDQCETMIGGRDAILLVTSIPVDNQLMCTIVIDRDGDGHAALAITCNCGANTDEAEEVLSYLATWQPA